MNSLIRLLLPVIALFTSGCFGEAPESPEPSPEKPVVTVAEIGKWDHPAQLELPGVVRPGTRAILSTRIAGTLLSINASPGDSVDAGALLATVDSRDVLSAIAAAKTKVTASRSAVEQARLESERLQRLYQEDLIARVQIERALVKLDELRARLQGAESELEAQQTNLSYARVTAPFDGLVAETLVDEGSFVGPGQPLLVLEERGRLRIDVPVSSQMAATMTSGQQVQVITGREAALSEARLVSVIPALGDDSTGQRLRLHTTSDKLSPGQVVSVLLPNPDTGQQQTTREWVSLPEVALIRRGQLTGTLVVNQPEGHPTVHLKWIKTAIPPGNRSERIPVTQGLSVGEQVVLNPSENLRDGQQVTISNAATKPAGT